MMPLILMTANYDNGQDDDAGMDNYDKRQDFRQEQFA